jgi:hypothetical protein
MTKSTLPNQAVEPMGLMVKLEAALVEYVEKFGPTDRAREALRLVSIWHAANSGAGVRPKPED